MTQPERQFDVVVLAALSVEHDAVVRALGAHPSYQWQGSWLHVGEVRGKRVLVFPLHGKGNIGSATVTEDVIWIWDPTVLVLAGIAAGARNGPADICLGDVLVPDQIVGYELGKVSPGRFEHDWPTYTPDSGLLDIARDLDPAAWATRIQTSRPSGTASRATPVAHIGSVLSGEKVLRDGVTLSTLRSTWPRAIGAEMEGVGCAQAARRSGQRFFMAKGVSDYGDSAKDDRWQEYAAEAAARFVVAVLAQADIPPKSGSRPARPRALDRLLAFIPKIPHRADHHHVMVALDALVGDVDRQLTRRLANQELLPDRLLIVGWTVGPSHLVGDATTLGWRIGVAPDLAGTAKPRLAGSLPDVVASFRRLRVRRVVITGQPGAGKTTLALTLAAGLLRDRQPGEPVPVLVPLSSWPVDVADFFTWIAGHLREHYPSLAARRHGPAVAALVNDRRVLPILDGLDEMAPAARDAAVRVLNRLPNDEPFILICRSAEYEDVVGRVGALQETPVVELLPVGIDQALLFLGQNERWQAARDRVAAEGPSGPLGAALRTPLMIDIARQTYQRARHDPAELADRQELADATAIERHLLEAFLAAAFEVHPATPDPAARLRDWPAPRTRPWLAFLARQSRTPGGADIVGAGEVAWWLLRRAVPGFRLVAAVVFGVLCGAAFGLGAKILRVPTGAIPSGVIAALGFGSLFWLLGESRRVDRRPGPAGPASATAKATVATGVWSGLAAGLPAGLIAGIAGATGAGVVFGVALGIPNALFLHRRRPRPAGLLWYQLGTGTLAGTLGWLIAGLVIGFPYARAYGAVPELPDGFVTDSFEATRHAMAYGSPREFQLGLAAAVLVGVVCGCTAATVAYCVQRWLPAVGIASGIATVASAGGVGAGIGAGVLGAVFGAEGAAGGVAVGLGFGLANGLGQVVVAGIPTGSPSWWRAWRETIRGNARALLRAALIGGLFGGLVTGLAYGDSPAAYGPVGGPVTDQVALAVATAVMGALTFGVGVGVALLFSPFAEWPRRPSRFSARLRGRLPALALRVTSGAVFGVVAGLVVQLAFVTNGPARTLAAGVGFGVAFGLAIWFRVPVDDVPAVDPGSTLRADRTATLVSAVLLGGGSGLAMLLAKDAPLGLMAGTIVLVTVVGSSQWLRFLVARIWLAVRGRLPVRPMAFLEDASRVGLIRPVGSVYQFRHARLRQQLESEPGGARPVGSGGTASGGVRRLGSGPARAARSATRLAAAVTVVLGLVLVGSARQAMSAGAWLGPRDLLASATAASSVAAGYGGCRVGPPAYALDGHTVRVRENRKSPDGWWCPVWRGANVTAFRTTVTVHSGAVVLLLIATADLKGGMAVELWTDGWYRIIPSSGKLGAGQVGGGPEMPLRHDRPTEVTLVDRDGALHVYVDGVHITSARHHDSGRAVAAVGIWNHRQPMDVTFANLTIWDGGTAS